MSESPSVPAASSDDGRAIPHNREAEEAVLGSVLVNTEVYYDLAHFLSAEDFFLHRNQWIWEAFTNLQEQRLPIDLLTVGEELERQGRLAEIGGHGYLTGLINNVPSSIHAEAYGHM
ncbi:MAG: DnaB-like helicase N-terminal domain-containing protein, partial [Nitrospiraceae bacterium]